MLRLDGKRRLTRRADFGSGFHFYDSQTLIGLKHGTKVSFNARPHPGLLPRGEGESFAAFLKRRAAGIASAASNKPETDDTIPSPWGEGKGEGGRQNKSMRTESQAPAARHICRTTPNPKPSSLRSGIFRPDGAWGFVAGGATKISLLTELE